MAAIRPLITSAILRDVAESRPDEGRNAAGDHGTFG